MFTKYMDTHNVPMYMGEYGLLMGAYGYGGNQWVSDMLDVINEKGLSASFHEYKPGLYSDYFNATRNDELYEIFEDFQMPVIDIDEITNPTDKEFFKLLENK